MASDAVIQNAWRRWRLTVAVWISAVVASGSGTAFEETLIPPENSLSAKRVQNIERIAEDFYARYGAQASDRRTRMRILRSFLLEDPCPVPPSGTIITSAQCEAAAAKLTDSLVLEKHPPLDPEELRAESLARYPTYEYGQKISVTYLASPVRKVTVSGTYRGKKNGRLVVGSHRISERDFNLLPENKAELLKFDPGESQRLRDEYIAQRKQEYTTVKQAYYNTVSATSLDTERKRGIRLNQQNGYVYFGTTWQPVVQVVDAIATQAKQRLLKAQAERQAVQAAEQQEKTIEKAEAATSTRAGFPASEAVAAEQKQSTAAGVATEPSAPEEAPASGSDALAEVVPATTEENSGIGVTEAAAEPEKEAVPARKTAEPAPRPTLREAEPDTSPMVKILAIALALGLAGAIGAYLVLAKKKNRPPVLSSFHDGTSEAGQEYWPIMDEAIPNTPHVAFRFPDREQALQALEQLSFVSLDQSTNTLTCSGETHIGLVPDQTGVIGFVAGQHLDYASWREAKTKLAAPQAEEVAVSVAPIFALGLPHDDDLGEGIEFVDKYDGADNDFGRYWKYRAESKKAAMQFLKDVTIGARGISVVVTSPQGVFTKTQQGVTSTKKQA